MLRDAAALLKDLLDRLLEGIRQPEQDNTLPDPAALREEAKRYE